MVFSTLTPLASAESANDLDIRQLICNLCKTFYDLGWATGTGGGISIRSGRKIFIAPSNVQKEKMVPEDIFILDPEGNIIHGPKKKNLKVSACKPLFMQAYTIFKAGAVLHSHSQNAVLATLLHNDLFRITGVEMIKGIEGMGVFDVLEVPIIENTAAESELSDSLKEAMIAHPKTRAVLVRGHGVYVWGKDWVQAKTHAECYDYLFSVSVKMKQLGLDPTNSRRLEEGVKL